MKRPLRILYCLVRPLQPDNVLFLAKQSRKQLGALALRAYLRRVWRIEKAQLTRFPAGLEKVALPWQIIEALGCLGFIQLCCQMKGTIKHHNEIDIQKPVSEKYPPDRKLEDNKLSAHLKGKSVAVVGPAKGGDNESEINGFDIVVRVGYSGADSFPAKTGTRCDVAFYAPHKMRKILQSDRKAALSDLQLVVIFKADRYFNHGINVNDIPVDESQLTEVPLPRFSKTKPNTLVKVIYNCIMAKPKTIKIFNADLFLSSDYPSGYIANFNSVKAESGWIQEGKGMCRSFAINHDPGEQIEFYKFFHEKGCFEVDGRLGEVIEMDALQYLGELDARYGEAVRTEAGFSDRI